MQTLKGQEIPLVIVSLCGVIVTVAHFFNIPILQSMSESLQAWVVIVAGFSLGIGIVNIVKLQGKHIQRRTEGQWIYSIVFFFFFFVQAATGFADLKNLANPIYVWIYGNVFNPLARAMYAILGFFIVTASYRAMKIRNIDSTLLLIAAVIVMLKNAPIGAVIWPGFPGLGTWILDVPSTAVNRAILIGVGLGAILYGIRVVLWYERGWLGGKS